MNARRSKIAAASALALLLSVLVLPATPVEAASKGLVVDGWEVAGNKVFVTVTNVGMYRASGIVRVHAVVSGVPMRVNVDVAAQAGQSVTVQAGFWAPVTGVISCIVSDSGDPVG